MNKQTLTKTSTVGKIVQEGLSRPWKGLFQACRCLGACKEAGGEEGHGNILGPGMGPELSSECWGKDQCVRRLYDD